MSDIRNSRHFSFLSTGGRLSFSPYLTFLSYISATAAAKRDNPPLWGHGLLKTHMAVTLQLTDPSHCRSFRLQIVKSIFNTTLHTDMNSSFWKWFFFFFLQDTTHCLVECPKNQSLLLFRWPNFFNHFLWCNNDFLKFYSLGKLYSQLLPSSEITGA